MRGSRSPVGRAAGAVLLAAAVLVSTGTARQYYEGRRSLEQAVRRKGEGDLPAAVAGFEDAVRAYFPGSPYPPRALRELEILAKGAEMRGEQGRAAAIWEVSRRAILSTRHVFQPHADQLSKAEQAIRRLAGGKEASSQLRDRMTARPADPSPLFSLMIALGLLAWTGGALGLFWGLPPVRSDGATGPRLPALISLAGLAVWLVACWLAG